MFPAIAPAQLPSANYRGPTVEVLHYSRCTCIVVAPGIPPGSADYNIYQPLHWVWNFSQYSVLHVQYTLIVPAVEFLKYSRVQELSLQVQEFSSSSSAVQEFQSSSSSGLKQYSLQVQLQEYSSAVFKFISSTAQGTRQYSTLQSSSTVQECSLQVHQ